MNDENDVVYSIGNNGTFGIAWFNPMYAKYSSIFGEVPFDKIDSIIQALTLVKHEADHIRFEDSVSSLIQEAFQHLEIGNKYITVTVTVGSDTDSPLSHELDSRDFLQKGLDSPRQM